MSTAVAKRESAELVEGAQNRQLEAIKRILSQRTPASEIRVRDGRGGQKLKYTDGAYVIRTLNEALGWDWDFLTDNEELIMNGDKPFEVKVRGTLTVRMDGKTVTKTQFGCQPIEMKRDGTAPVSIGDAYKGAATDAMKKCASLLGIALDLYDSDYKPEKYAEPEPVKTVRLEGAQPKTPVERDRGVIVLEHLKGEVKARQEAAERMARLEGGQPTNSDGLPDMEGAAGHVVELAKKLKWGEAALAGAIAENFGIVIAPGKLQGYLECATKDELRELYRIMNSQGKGAKR